MITKAMPNSLTNFTHRYAGEVDFFKEGVYVCGGFVRSYFLKDRPADMDVYFKDEELFEEYKTICESAFQKAHETPRAISFHTEDKFQIQLIKFIFAPTLPEILSQFDFTITQCGFEKDTLYIHEDFFEHLATRNLVFTGSQLPLSSLKRAFKYVLKGFDLCDEMLLRILEAVHAQVDFSDTEALDQHIESFDPDGQRRVRPID